MKRPSAPVIIGWVAALVLLALGFFLEPIARVASPRLAVALATGFGHDLVLGEWSLSVSRDLAMTRTDADRGGEVWESPPRLRDPWGRPWRKKTLPTARWTRSDVFVAGGSVYSVGPGGLDDSGGGDDVVVDEVATIGSGLIPPVLRESIGATLVVLGGLLAIWTVVLWLAVPPRRRSTAAEAQLAAGLTVPWVLGCAVWMALLIETAPARATARIVERQLHLKVPAGWAAIGTAGFVSFALALAWRLTRPREEDRPS